MEEDELKKLTRKIQREIERPVKKKEKEDKERLRRINRIKECFLVEPKQSTIEMYLSWPAEKFYRVFKKIKRKERMKAREEASFFMQHLAIEDPLYGMVQVMCVSYYSYMTGWKETWGESSFKPIYAVRYALHSRNRSWSVSFLNSFLASITSFKELLIAICAQPDEMPDRVEELRDWLEHQTTVNIPSATWSKGEALESNVGSAENLGFYHSISQEGQNQGLERKGGS